MYADISWCCDLPAEGVTTDSVRESYTVRVIARWVNHDVYYDLVSLANDADLKGHVINAVVDNWVDNLNVPKATVSRLSDAMARLGVTQPDFYATQVAFTAKRALWSTPDVRPFAGWMTHAPRLSGV